MRILCSISGLDLTVSHFPGSLTSREYYHPVFALPQKKLLAHLGKWSAGELTPVDSYLLFLATLKSTQLVDFRVASAYLPATNSIVAQNMEALARIAVRLNTAQDPRIFPHYVVSPDTKDLANVQYWIENWEESFAAFQAGKLRDIEGRDEWKRLAHREAALERLIKNPHRSISSYARQIADWATLAGSFPEFSLVNHFTGQPSSCAQYWEDLIIKCASESSLFSIRRADLIELLEHCEDHIPIGSIYSNALFTLLRKAVERQRNFIGLGDLDIRASTYAFIQSDSTVEQANLDAMIQAAPDHLPEREEYPTLLAYLRAKLRYEMAQKESQKSRSQDPES